MNIRLMLAVIALAACAGCGVTGRDYVNLETGLYNNLGDVMTFQHDFTEPGAEYARKKAEGYCAQSKRVAVMTRRVCTMSSCTSDYQCMTNAEAARLAPAEAKGK